MNAPVNTSVRPAPAGQLAFGPKALVPPPARRLASAVRRRRVLTALVGVLAALFWIRVLLGDYTITVPDFFRIVAGEQIPGASYILMESKLPRAVLAIMVGVAFGVGGAVFQGVLRNPLASPDVIGISTGASAGAVIALSVLGWQGGAVSVAAVVGALSCAVLVRTVAGGSAGHRLVLGGIGVSAGLLSVIHYVFIRADDWDVQALLRWLTGSLSQATWSTITVFALALLVLLPAVGMASRSLAALELGDDMAAALGVGLARRDGLLALATVLVACGVASSGPIAFVAFLSGPIARMLLRGRASLLAAGLVGACVVLGGDYIGAYLIGNVNLPVGVITGALGAPFLLWLLATGRTGRKVA